MLLKTRHFGEIEIDEDSVLTFKDGVLGFENVKKYVLINDKDESSLFKWLQGVDEPNLAFVLINPYSIRKDYDITLEQSVLNDLSIKKEEDVLIFSIVVVPEDITKLSMNLKAPIIINACRKTGKQLVLDTDRYNVRHYILEELQGQEVAQNACSDKEEGTVDSNK